MYYVYGYRDLTSLDPFFYVGKGQGNRAYEHIHRCKDDNDASRNSHFYRKLRKMLKDGTPYEVVIINRDMQEEESLLLEMDLIAKYGRLDLETGCLCNLTPGGQGGCGIGGKGSLGYVKTIEQRLNSAYALVKRNREDPDIRIKSADGTRRKRGKPLFSYDLVTQEVVKEYECLRDVEVDNFSRTQVTKCCSGERPSYAGLGWSYQKS